MNCKNLRRRSKNYKYYLYCIKKKQIINIEDCRLCSDKEFKTYKTMKKKSSKLDKLERERVSLIYDDLTTCCECGIKSGVYDERINRTTFVAINEVYEGSYRIRSIKNKCVCPLCIYCHSKFHNDISFNLKYKVMFQNEFLKAHSNDEFIKMFGKDYIYLQKNFNKFNKNT